MSDLLVRTIPIGGGALARGAIAGELPQWYPAAPHGTEGWRERVREVSEGARTGWLDRLAPAFGFAPAPEGDSSSPAAARLARAAKAGGAVVTTGQQPGLFGGPIYTWSKALGALALADLLEEATGIPVAPVFWAATDDADLAEASNTWVSHPGGATELRMPGGDVVGGTLSMADVALPDVARELAELARASGSAADPAPLELARRAYSEGATVGSAYVELLRGLLEPLGISVLDASHGAVRGAADPLLRDALRRADGVDVAIRERTGAIEAAGYTPQVAVVDGLSPVFVYEADGRRRAPFEEAARIADDAGSVLGPNVLLRPVVERSLLPTVGYVAGPGELAYFAQVGALADALELPAPLPIPRWSTTLLEPDVVALLQRHGLTVESLEDQHAPERELATRLLPDSVRGPIQSLRDAVHGQTSRLAAAAEGDGLLPATVPAGAERDMMRRLDRLERRYRAAITRREVRAFAELTRLRGALRPGGTPQERALNIIPLLARYGTGVLVDMAAAARSYVSHLTGIPDVRGARNANGEGDAGGGGEREGQPVP